MGRVGGRGLVVPWELDGGSGFALGNVQRLAGALHQFFPEVGLVRELAAGMNHIHDLDAVGSDLSGLLIGPIVGWLWTALAPTCAEGQGARDMSRTTWLLLLLALAAGLEAAAPWFHRYADIAL